MPRGFLTDAQVAGMGVSTGCRRGRIWNDSSSSTGVDREQNPQLQLDALATEDCLKVHTDRASGTKADRPQWTACLADLRPGGTLVIWRIDRLGRNLRDLIDIVTTLQARGVGFRSLSNGLVDTTTAHGAVVFRMFALMAEYEAALIRERTQAGLAAARARGRKGGRKPKMTPELIGKAPNACTTPASSPSASYT